jgi:RNA repair, ligase-Pnkp-associating, region of Hen1
MLLTKTSAHTPAADLGFLLHKSPARFRTEERSFRKVRVAAVVERRILYSGPSRGSFRCGLCRRISMYWLRGTIGLPSTDLSYAVVICTNFSLAARVPHGPWKPQLPRELRCRPPDWLGLRSVSRDSYPNS